jgi:hypothetical protein
MYSFRDIHPYILDDSSMWMSINPRNIPKPARRELEHALRRGERSILLPGQLDRDISRSGSACSVVTGSESVVLGHGGICSESASNISTMHERLLQHTQINPRISGPPLDVPTRTDTVIEVGVCKDRAVECIPRSTKGTLAFDLQG